MLSETMWDEPVYLESCLCKASEKNNREFMENKFMENHYLWGLTNYEAS